MYQSFLMGEKALANLSIEEYLQHEAGSDVRHEYHNGQVFAMAGGSLHHGILGNAINAELNILCRGKKSTPFNGDVRVRIEAANRFVYPQASVVCGPVQTSREDEHAIVNPILIAEVLSDSTEGYDRGAKF
ncbi:MAG: Uma2 family endonuclease, partial [Bacteroidota bacterium]